MPPVGFEPTISAGERPQTYALEHAATGTGGMVFSSTKYDCTFTHFSFQTYTLRDKVKAKHNASRTLCLLSSRSETSTFTSSLCYSGLTRSSAKMMMIFGLAAACAETVSPSNTAKLRIISRHVSIVVVVVVVDCNPENIRGSKS